MKMMKNAVKTTLGLLFLGSAVFAQSLADAKVAIDAEQYQKAKTILKSLTASQPTNAENFFYLGNVYLINEYPDSAKATYTKGTAADAEFPLNFVGLGAVELENGNASGAKANFDKAVALDKKGYKANLYTGRAYVDATNSNPAAALPYLELAKADKNGMKDAQVFLALADAYRKQGKNSEAFSNYRTAFDMDNKLIRAKVELGVINKEARAFQEAITEFNGVIATNPTYGPAYRELAETYYRWAGQGKEFDQTKMAEARKQYQKYVELTDKSLESRLREADFMLLTRDYKALEANAQAMAAMSKANLRVFRYLGYAAYENGNYPASVQALKEFVTKADPKRVLGQDYAYLGRAQLKTGDKANGIANLQKAITIDTANAELPSEVAKLIYDTRDYPAAQKAYELAVKNPKNPTPLGDNLYLALSYYFDYGNQARDTTKTITPNKELLTKADAAFTTVIEKAPTNTDPYIFRARTRRLMDDAENPKGLMVDDYVKYTELIIAKGGQMTETVKRNMIEAYNNLGAHYAKINDIEKAKDYLNKSVAIDPTANSSYAANTLKILNGSK